MLLSGRGQERGSLFLLSMVASWLQVRVAMARSHKLCHKVAKGSVSFIGFDFELLDPVSLFFNSVSLLLDFPFQFPDLALRRFDLCIFSFVSGILAADVLFAFLLLFLHPGGQVLEHS